MTLPLRDKVDQHDGDDNEQKDGADIRVIEFADGLDQSWPIPPAPTKPITAAPRTLISN